MASTTFDCKVPWRAAEILLLAGPSDRSAKNVGASFAGLIVKIVRTILRLARKSSRFRRAPFWSPSAPAREEPPLEAQWK